MVKDKKTVICCMSTDITTDRLFWHVFVCCHTDYASYACRMTALVPYVMIAGMSNALMGFSNSQTENSRRRAKLTGCGVARRILS
jgi:hypothetical protein